MDDKKKSGDFSKFSWNDLARVCVRRHFTGAFTEQVCEYLGRVEPVLLSSGKDWYLAVDLVELGDNLLGEEVRVWFRLAATPPSAGGVAEWDGAAVPAQKFHYPVPPDAEPGDEIGSDQQFFFTFTSALSLQENIEALTRFLNEELSLSPKPSSQPPRAGKTKGGSKRPKGK